MLVHMSDALDLDAIEAKMGMNEDEDEEDDDREEEDSCLKTLPFLSRSRSSLRS